MPFRSDIYGGEFQSRSQEYNDQDWGTATEEGNPFSHIYGGEYSPSTLRPLGPRPNDIINSGSFDRGFQAPQGLTGAAVENGNPFSHIVGGEYSPSTLPQGLTDPANFNREKGSYDLGDGVSFYGNLNGQTNNGQSYPNPYFEIGGKQYVNPEPWQGYDESPTSWEQFVNTYNQYTGRSDYSANSNPGAFVHPQHGLLVPRDVYNQLDTQRWEKSAASQRDDSLDGLMLIGGALGVGAFNGGIAGFASGGTAGLSTGAEMLGGSYAGFGGGAELAGGIGLGAAEAPWGTNMRFDDTLDFFNPEWAEAGTGGASNLTSGGLSELLNPQSGMTQSLAPSFPGAQSPITSGYNLGGSAASAGSASPSLIDKLLNQFKPADIAKSGLNYFLNQRTSDQLAQAAQEAAARSDALSQPKRAPYQEQLSSLLSNPEAFYSTNPVVKAQLDLARQQFLANTGKMGTGGTQFNDYLKNVQNVASGTFNDQAQLLSMLGGFNQGTGYAGSVYGSLQGQSIQQQQQANYFLPDTIKKLFSIFDSPSSSGSGGSKIISSY